MKLSFEKDHLMNGINIVLKAVPSKTTMPILECILIDAVSDEIKLTGNDMELGIETKRRCFGLLRCRSQGRCWCFVFP